MGETLKDREDGNTNAVVAAQLAAIKAGVDAVSADAWAHVVIAYEPVWAIGTGVVATPAQAQDTQKFIRGWLADNVRNRQRCRTSDFMRILLVLIFEGYFHTLFYFRPFHDVKFKAHNSI